jgi:hypothetical protein
MLEHCHSKLRKRKNAERRWRTNRNSAFMSIPPCGPSADVAVVREIAGRH